MINYIESELTEIIDCFTALCQAPLMDAVRAIADRCIATLSTGGKIIFCGNGGSAADAQHLAAELVGRYRVERAPLAAISLTVDSSAVTAIANDYGYEQVFARQLLGVGQPGDLLIGLSTSGNSPNVVEAVKVAQTLQITSVGFTGQSGGTLRTLTQLCLQVPSSVTAHIQEMHIACGHILCGLVEQHFVMQNSR